MTVKDVHDFETITACLREQASMKCSIKGCPGMYEAKMIIHTVKPGNEVIVFENVPAEVCNVCSDTLLLPETVRRLEVLIQSKGKPDKLAPLYEYA